MRPQRIYEQVRLGGEVRVQGAVADARGCSYVRHPRAVVTSLGEHIRRGPQQAVTSLGGGDARDASHERIKRTFI